MKSVEPEVYLVARPELDYEEVAGRLGISQNAARLRVSRALRSLTVQLQGAG